MNLSGGIFIILLGSFKAASALSIRDVTTTFSPVTCLDFPFPDDPFWGSLKTTVSPPPDPATDLDKYYGYALSQLWFERHT